MVLFNDPMPCPDPCERAVKMAVEMRDRVIELAAKWRKLGHDLGFGMGIAHGFATLGRISSEGRFDYTAIGRVVNLAARLCGEAKSGQILVDGKVHTAVESADRDGVGRASWSSRASTARSRRSTSRRFSADMPVWPKI